MQGIKSYFSLTYKGGRLNKEFKEGTVLILKPTDSINTGDIALLGVNGKEASLSKVELDKDLGSITLNPMSNNPLLDKEIYSLDYDSIHVYGKVIQSVRFY